MSAFRFVYLLLLIVTALAIAYATFIIIALNWWNDGPSTSVGYAVFSIIASTVALLLIAVLGRQIALFFRKQ